MVLCVLSLIPEWRAILAQLLKRYGSVASDLRVVYTWEGGLKPKSTSGTPLGEWGPLEVGYLPKNKELEMDCGPNFNCKLKKTGHGPLSMWADFLKWNYPNELYLDLFHIYWIFPYQHSLTSACVDFSIFLIFGPFFMFCGKSLPVLLLVFRNCYFKEVATNTHPWDHENAIQNCHLGFYIDIPSTEKKNKGPSPLIPWCISKSGVPLVSTNHIAIFLWAPALCLLM